MGGRRCQFNKFSQTIALKQTTLRIQAVDVTAEAFIQMSYAFNSMTKMLQENKKKFLKKGGDKEATLYKRQRITDTSFELPAVY